MNKICPFLFLYLPLIILLFVGCAIDEDKQPTIDSVDSLPNNNVSNDSIVGENLLLNHGVEKWEIEFCEYPDKWLLPRINDSIIFKGWTINVEYFSEIMHAMRTQNSYGLLFDAITSFEKGSDTRDSKAIKRIATAYLKLIFPQWNRPEDVDKDEFDTYCLQPAINRRGIIKEQCHYIDSEFKTQMPGISIV